MNQLFPVLTNQAFPLFMFLSIASIALFSFVAVATWSESRRREREAYYKSEMMKKIAESGAGGGSALAYLREQEKIGERRRREGMKLGGLITAVIGIAVMIFFWAMAHDPKIGVPNGIYFVGVIPLLIGIALLLYSYLLAPRSDAQM